MHVHPSCLRRVMHSRASVPVIMDRRCRSEPKKQGCPIPRQAPPYKVLSTFRTAFNGNENSVSSTAHG